MPNKMTNPTFFPVRVNSYVPAMAYSSDVNYNGGTRVNFGRPALANATAIGTALSIAVAGTFDLSSAAQLDAPYGRNISVVGSGATTATLTVHGWDYLGQPISENFTLTGTTPVVGLKSFKTIRALQVNTVTAATTVNLGSGAKLGLPYKSLRVQFETAAGAFVAAGTLQAPVLTDPATAATGDPRGQYTPTTTLDGATEITAVFDCANDVNAANNGGLHGIRQFAA